MSLDSGSNMTFFFYFYYSVSIPKFFSGMRVIFKLKFAPKISFVGKNLRHEDSGNHNS